MSKTLLFVDDEAELREIYKELFEGIGYQVMVAESGEAALKILEANKVDFVLSDVRMANGDGVYLLKTMTQRKIWVPHFYYMTGYSDFTLDEAKDWGASGVFRKPHNFEHLLRIIQDILK